MRTSPDLGNTSLGQLLERQELLRGSLAASRASEGLRPGQVLAGPAFNATARHPVVLVPGVIASALEVWQSRPCAEG